MKRCTSLALALVMAAALAVLPACTPNPADSGGAAPESAAASPESPQTSEQKVDLVFATFKSEWTDTLNTLFEGYMAENPNVNSIAVYSGESGDFFSDLKAMLAAGTFPNILNMRGDNFGMDWKEYLQDLGGQAAIANTPEGFVDSFVWDGITYGAYYNIEINGIVWNMETLEALGYDNYPMNNTEFQEVIAKLDDAGLPGGIACFGTTQQLYNHIGSMAFNAHPDPAGHFNDLVGGVVEPASDPIWGEWYDYVRLLSDNAQPNVLQMDTTTGHIELFNDQYTWMATGGTALAGKAIDYNPDFIEKYRIGPYVMNDTDPLYVINCQGFVVSNQGDDATNQAALDLFNWFYTSDEVAGALVKDHAMVPTSKSFVPSAEILDPFSLAAYEAMQNNAYAPIRYYNSETLNLEWGVTIQKYIAGELDKDAALASTGELFRTYGDAE